MPRRHNALRDRRDRASGGRLTQLVEVGGTHVGRGVFARRGIGGGEIIGEVLGHILPTEPEDPHYCMELPSGRVLEPAPPLRFVNHGCDPNCELFYWFDEDGSLQEDRLWLQTIRPIRAGEELLIDYCWPASAAIPCRCGSPACRGWIVDPEELHLLTAPDTDRDAGGSSPASRPSS